MSRATFTEAAAWRTVIVLSIVSAGAYIGNEAAHYFWDLTGYVEALDSPYPYRTGMLPFLYPPFAADVFTLARSHLFELLSIAYVAAALLLVKAFADLNAPRRFEWLLAVTAMGGLGVVSLQSGNVAILMNLTVLALALQAGMGNPTALKLLPIAIGAGALIKPQFACYLGLLLFLERSRVAAVVKATAVGLTAIGVHVLYMAWRPDDWNEYTQAAYKRTVVEKDFAWGPAGFVKNFDDSTSVALAAYVVGFLVVAALAYAAWRKSVRDGQRVPDVAIVSLAFVVLTFANPRIPPYDLYTALLALSVCCALAARADVMSRVMIGALAINLLPWAISEFARVPSAWPWWMQDLHLMHLLGVSALLVVLSRVGIKPWRA